MEVKSTQQERFKYMREHVIEKTQNELADILGINQREVSFIESGRKQKIDTEILYILNKKFGIHIEWLLFGEGNPTVEDDAIAVEQTYQNVIAIPFFNAKAAAGVGETVPEYEEKDYMHFDLRWLENVRGLNPNHLSIIQAKGESMQPTINDGDLLLVDSSDRTGRNGVYVIRQDSSELRVKRLSRDFNGNLQIISDNPSYPVETYDNTTTDFFIEVLGRVVWNGTKENV